MKKIFKIIAIPLVSWLLCYVYSTEGEYYVRYSPDGQYRVYSAAYNYAQYLPIPFYRYGDMPGKVYLYDTIEKKVINSAPIEMVSLSLDVRWRKNEAYFIGGEFTTWTLPREIKLSKPK